MKIVDYEAEIKYLKERIAFLESERLKKPVQQVKKTVSTPAALAPIFEKAEKLVGDYFSQLQMNPSKGSITIEGERYILMRASSITHEFLHQVKNLYADKGEKEAIRIGQNLLFDISHVLGLEDAKTFHTKMNLTNPVSKLSAGPVHFAYAGWANVEILDGNPTEDDNFYLKYNHPYSFEADSWIDKGIKSNEPVCTMNSGYSSGWCEESFGVPLTAVEISCRAKGDDNCTFIMAHPDKIKSYLDQEKIKSKQPVKYDIPLFFERKKVEQEIIKSLEEKSILLKEVHHRVKNNLQIISSLLNLQSRYLKDEETNAMFSETKNRIKAIALVHEKLYKSSDVQHVNLKKYLQSIVDLLQDSFDFGYSIRLNSDGLANNKIKIEKAMPCGLIINELVSNSIKYAFVNQKSGEITITVSENHGQYSISVADNGVGLPDDFSFDSINSLGFEIILSLVEQLNGSIDFENEKGVNFIINF